MSGSTAGKGKLVVISGPSGTGKSTVCRMLAERDPDIRISVSATTRPPRKNEHDGRDYHFISRREFESKVRSGEFVEHAEYAGNLYGTLKSEVGRAMAEGKILVMDIDVQGSAQVTAAYPDALTIFLEPPTFDELLRRLNARGTDSPDARRRRVEIAKREMDRRGEYRHRVVNDDLNEAVGRVFSIISGVGIPGSSAQSRKKSDRGSNS